MTNQQSGSEAVPARAKARLQGLHQVEVKDNPVLGALYTIGLILVGLGLIVVFVAFSKSISAFNTSGSYAWIALGAAAANLGGLMLVGGLVAHAINWKIGRSAGRR